MAVDFHENLIRIDPGLKIWRYMDIGKYESFLKDRGLFFCRADKFSDPFEGSIPVREYEHRKIAFGANLDGNPISEERVKSDLNAISDSHKKLKSATIINCWHINEGESDAMWRLYLKDNEGIAIQSSPKLLFEALEKTSDSIRPSRVRYLNYEKEIWYNEKEYPHIHYNFIIPLIHKRAEYSHEREFRLLIELREAENDPHYWFRPPGIFGNSKMLTSIWRKLNYGEAKGKMIHFNVDSVVEKIILPPTSNEFVDMKIKQMTRKY